MTTAPTSLGLDVGSHGVRVVAARGATVIATGHALYAGPPPPVRRALPVYLGAVIAAVRSLPASVRAEVCTVAITGIRGSVVAVDQCGRPASDVVPDWDPAFVGAARLLFDRFGEGLCERTGCPAFPLSGLPKILELARPGLTVLSVQDAVAHWLTGVVHCSSGSALRLGVLDRNGMSYDEDLLIELGVPSTALAPLLHVGDVIGLLIGDRADQLGLSLIPAVAAPGDGPSALRAALADPQLDGCRLLLVSLGTSTVVSTELMNLSLPVPPQCTREILGDGRRSVETGDGTGTAAVDWTCQLLGVESNDLDALAAAGGAGEDAEVVLPAMDVWGARSPGRITGFAASFGRADLAAATLKFVAAGAHRAIDRIREAYRIDCLVLTGGGARSAVITNHIMIQAKIPVVNRGSTELAALGAALVAGAAA